MPETDIFYHEPVVDVIVQARNAAGRPSVVLHLCRHCGRRVSDKKHVGVTDERGVKTA
jgi:hypothetical protein